MFTPEELVSLKVMKQHLRVNHDEEDELVLLYASSALEWCLWYCDNPNIKTVGDVSARFKSAMLLVLGDLFEHREQNTEINLYHNSTAEDLLWADRDWRDNRSEGAVNGTTTTYP
ncbi:hypothetical protein R84981_000977 [Carnimonas sp. R-84981]|uniref:head-tail connector protein n=1 Tax=Carnimonas bestiolae TaxID=3402172 RepID=UPI003EDBDD8F